MSIERRNDQLHILGGHFQCNLDLDFHIHSRYLHPSQGIERCFVVSRRFQQLLALAFKGNHT